MRIEKAGYRTAEDVYQWELFYLNVFASVISVEQGVLNQGGMEGLQGGMESLEKVILICQILAFFQF